MTEPINPYEASQSAEVPISVHKAPQLESRRYNARLDWSDRLVLLRSLTPGRIAIVAWALLWGKDLYDYLMACIAWFASNETNWDSLEIALAGEGLLYMVRVFLMLYLFWLGWQWIDRLQDVAAGKSNSFNRWSQLHLRTEKLGAIAAALAIFSELVRIAIDRGTTLADSGLGPS